MFTLNDIAALLPDGLDCEAKCKSNCEGETRKNPLRDCDPPPKKALPVERGGTSDKGPLIIWVID